MPLRQPIDFARHEGRARAALNLLITRGAATYDRALHLPRVLAVGPDIVADVSAANRRQIVRRLARALRAERNRGRAGHWTYDLNRHIALAQAYAAEKQLLAAALSGKPKAADVFGES